MTRGGVSLAKAPQNDAMQLTRGASEASGLRRPHLCLVPLAADREGWAEGSGEHGARGGGVAARIHTFLAVILAIGVGCRASAPTDADLLKGLHEKVIRAHLQSNVELLLEDEASDYVVASRGAVTRPTLEERRGRLGPYLQRTAFHEYRDAVDPMVSVSGDGTLGWVVVQVQARGLQTTAEGRKEPLAFASAWIELYEKRNGRWLRVGNVSNFKE